MATSVTDNYFEYGVHKYFRGNAHLVDICSYGEKKDPIGNKAYLDPQAKVVRDHLIGRIVKGTTVSISWSSTTQASVEINGQIKAFKVGVSAAAGYTYSAVKSANLKLYNIFINEGPLKTLLNTDAAGARKFLADEGADGRIISECWVVMEADLAAHFDSSTSLTVSVPVAGNLNLTASGGTKGSQTITISPGTIFAYKMHKVKDWNSDKTKAENLEADYYNG